MIRFNEEDNGNYYISVVKCGAGSAGAEDNGLIRFLTDRGFKIDKYDAEEILIDINSVIHKLSLNELREMISEYCKCVVSYFIVDTDHAEGRYYG